MKEPNSGGVRISPIDPRDAVEFLEAVDESADEICRWLGSHAAPADAAAVDAFVRDWQRGWMEKTKYGFVCREVVSDHLIGFGLINYIHERYRIANLGYWVRSGCSGRGYGTAITRLVAAFGFTELGLVRLELVIEPGNAASRRVAEKIGAVEEGLLRNRLTINGNVRDALMYSLVPG